MGTAPISTAAVGDGVPGPAVCSAGVPLNFDNNGKIDLSIERPSLHRLDSIG
jgi:hypothetical protein